ncbi:hypothetical protein ACC703_39365, partial [Rhizobium ruizarguesonis]
MFQAAFGFGHPVTASFDNGDDAAERLALLVPAGCIMQILSGADLKTSTDLYRDVVGLEPAASFEERKVAFLW